MSKARKKPGARARATARDQKKAAGTKGKASGRSSAKTKKSKQHVVIEWAITIAAAVALAFLIQAFLVKPFRVPTPSMADTVAAGDRVLIDRTAYHRHDVNRGDVVAFTGPAAVRGQVLLKRIVGLPGDTLSLKDGVLYVDGRAEEGDYVRRVDGVAERTEAPAETASAPWSLAEPYTVPAGQYYMLGDNRSESFDSRFWGPVPRSSLFGPAFFVYWPPQRLGTL